MDISALKYSKELEEEDRRLKQMYADLSLENQVLNDIVEKSYKRQRKTRVGVIRQAETPQERNESLSGCRH